jgi:dienelactone hydrolase
VLNRIYPRLIIMLAAATALAGCGGGSHSTKPSGLDAPFAYDTSKALDLTTRKKVRQGPVELSDIAFKGAAGETIPAYLIVPSGKSPHPAVIYAHGSSGSRDDLLASAVGLAEHGAVTIALDMNYSATRGAGSLPKGIDGVKVATSNEIESVVEVRRAVDLLRSLPEVDKSRIGFVGWSAGARTGAVLAGVDHRIKAFDLLAGGAAPVSFYLRAAPANIRGDLKGLLAKTDPLRYIPHAAPSALLFQDGRQDKVVPRSALVALAGAASSPKELRFYDSGHIPSTAAWKYSATWLSRHLGLTRKA